MNREGTIGLILIALLFGGIVLLARPRTAIANYNPIPLQTHNPGNIRMVPVGAEPRRYQNKETRRIEYNADGLPTLIEIIRDSVVA